MRPRMQGSAPQEEEEHPYELLLTAETKKLGTTDGRTEGMPACLPACLLTCLPTCLPARLPASHRRKGRASAEGS